ncbi:hypothetical protein HRG_007108 [Hirsutella rhossiliensis]|uniref:Uncharacterized protein n=1 Tax=Hirsutella rhossiliensis TaxID=111463 RepID=A0A9P8SGG7_9HYPO|nr:uncharacterized protein HRG_07108 [Hirsutella rhossiliensis]KAH0962028.1 hypothetical protein HRG_07108 [Hirsutella rhossiliensis]
MRDFSRGFLSYCDDALNGAPTRAGKNASHGRDGGYRSDLRRYGPEGDGAVRGRPLPARPDPQPRMAPHVQPPKRVFGDWAACLGTEAVEGFQNWHTYTVADCPRQLTDIWGSAVDYGQAIREEIKLQTGVEPVDVHESQETRRGLRPAYRDDDCVIQGGYTEEMATLRHRPISATDHQEPPTYPINRRADAAAEKTTTVTTVIVREVRELLRALPGRPQAIEKHAVRKMGSRLYRQTNMELERLAPTTSPQSSQGPTPSPCARAVEARQMQRPPPSSAQAPDPTALLPPQDEITKNPRQEDYPSSPGQRGKAEPYHSMALRLAEAEDYDIVLIQKPNFWIEKRAGHTFHAFAPERAWDPDQAPRVMSYARNDANIRVEQICSIPTRDILWLRVNGILIINFYRYEGTPEPLDYLLPWQMPCRG